MPPGAKVQGRQNGVCKNFTIRVKSRSQARLHRRQTSSDSSRLVRTVGESGAKRDMEQNDSGVARGQVGARARGAPPRGVPRSSFYTLFSTYSHRF